MKKLVRSFIVICFIIALLLIFIWQLNKETRAAGANSLIVYNWGDYIDMDVIKSFERETGIKVVYQTFESNEAMMAKIRQGGAVFDVCVPSEYTIQKMREENLLLPIDMEQIPNIEHIDQRFINLEFDPDNQYSIPYFWGTVGIIYNPEEIGHKIQAWNDLWGTDLANKILLVDGAREVVGLSLNSLGYSLNDTNPEHLATAAERLSQLAPNVKAIVGDEIKGMLINEEAYIGVVWSGDAVEIMGENDKLDYVIPNEGSNLWIDNMAIPTTAKNVDGAHKFINFMLDPKFNAQNTEYVGYSTPNKSALQFIDPEITSDVRFYPGPEITDRLEMYYNIGKKNLAKYSEIFLQFKMHLK